MDRTLQELRRLRRTGRTLLLLQRAMQWAAAILAAWLLCAVADYLLRLPGWLRFVLGVALLFFALTWCWKWSREVRRFSPSLSTLALRAERIFPSSRGRLASAVDFAQHPALFAHPQRTADLTESTMIAARQGLAAVRLGDLIDWRPTLRHALPLAAAVVLMLCPLMLARQESSLAARRWLLPFGAAEWPTRQFVVTPRVRSVASTDQPLRFAARVVRGHRDAMRTWLHYRIHDADGSEGPWRSLLMTPSHGGEGRYERVLEFGRDVTVDFGAIVPDPLPYADVSYRVEAGDYQTEIASIQLVPRPAVREVILTVAPPDYAFDLVPADEVRMHEALSSGGQVATATALRGSQIRMQVVLNKPVPWSAGQIGAALPGLADVARVDETAEGAGEAPPSGNTPSVAVAFELDRSVETEIKIAGAFGFKTLSGRLYRVQAMADTPPRVAIVEPEADEQVLPTARIALRAVARDDVGIASVHMEASLPAPGESESDRTTLTIGASTERRSHVASAGVLSLSEHALGVGDEVLLTAVARDVYRRGEATHPPVRSGVRRLVIIDPATMLRQVRARLSTVRRNAEQTAEQQRARMTESKAGQGAQRRITNRIKAMADALEGVRDRMTRNALEGPELFQLVERASDMVQKAASSSESAAASMPVTEADRDPNSAAEAARAQQEQVAETLESLARLLEQGRDVLALQLTLQRLEREQQEVAAETRRLLPRTAGRPRDALDESLNSAVSELSKGQRSIEAELNPLVENMQVAAEDMESEASPAQDQAAAMALRDAAAEALRRGLGGTLASVQANIDSNRLAQAGTGQQEVLDVMRQMLKALEEQQRRKTELLRRRLAELAESIRRLIHQQKQQRARVEKAAELPTLEGPLRTMQANTRSVERSAASESALQDAAVSLADAASAQGLAATTVRDDRRAETMAQQDTALDFLHAALAAVEQQQQAMKQEEEQRRREQLQAAYRALAVDQSRLRGESDGLLRIDTPNRKWTIAMRSAANRQADIRIAARTLGDGIGETTLFRSMHDRIDTLGTRAAESLRAASRDRGTLVDQQRIAVTLETMADALEEDPEDPVFSDGEGITGGGGGGGSKSGEESPVTSLAELKLLRGLQEDLRLRTGRLHDETESGVGAPARRAEDLQGLAEEQKTLREIGARLLEKEDAEARILRGDRSNTPEGHAE